MKLGEMLIRDGRLSQDQLKQAMASQARDGGRLGSILVELGFVDAETLTVYLGIELGIPIASGATLERCKRSAVRLLTPQQATRHRCVPIVIQGQTLILAIDDPHDMQTLDALHELTGYLILPRVAPEIRIHYYLERFYGVPRPARFRALGEQARGNPNVGSHQGGLPGPSLPGLPPRRDAVAAPTPAPVLRRAASRTPSLSPEQQQALEIDANDLVIELEADDAEVAGQAPPADAMAALGSPAVQPSKPRPELVRLPLAETLRRIATTDQRGAVADALLGYAAGVFEVGILCLARDDLAIGWRGFGPALDLDRIETLLIPLGLPSLLHSAVEQKTAIAGRPAQGTIHDHLCKVLRCQAPATAVAMPIAIGPRLVNIFYGHRAGGAAPTDAELDGLREVGEAASQAYVRLISASKKKSRAK